VRNEAVLQRVREESNILHTTKEGRKVNWISRTLRRNCLLEHVTEEKIKGRMDFIPR
jgi:hypothetical protein